MFCFCDKQTLCIYMSCIYSFFLQIDNDYCQNCWYRNSKNSASICKRLVWKVGLQKFGYREHRNTPCSSCFFWGAQLYWRLFQNKMKLNRKQCFFSGYSALRSCAVLDYFVTTAVRMYIYIMMSYSRMTCAAFLDRPARYSHVTWLFSARHLSFLKFVPRSENLWNTYCTT